MSKEGKLVIKKENETIAENYGTCIMDGHKQKVGNFRIEPPGLFRGRGDHHDLREDGPRQVRERHAEERVRAAARASEGPRPWLCTSRLTA